MTQLIAEELILLIYGTDGTARRKGMRLDLAIGGALLLQLVQDGHLELVDKKIEATGKPDRPAHPELAAALAIAEVKPRSPGALLTKLTRKTRRRLLDGLVASRVLATQPRAPFGKRYPLADPAPRDRALRRLRVAVIDGGQPDQRTATLISMIQAAGLASRIFPDDDQKAVKARLAQLAEADPESEPVRKAIQAAIMSQIVGIVIQVVIMVVSSSGD
ncbi:MAG: GPP34 family phosphoprotein [Pseudonocardia sp.]|nr:GPP34 family phosphoprotein [Pseudonocardia sp.]